MIYTLDQFANWEDMKNKVICADALELLKRLPDNSIDMILCDLPYGTTACAWDSIIPFELLWEQYKRIVKDNTPIVLTASQPFTTDLINSNRGWFKYCWVWEKEQGTNQMLKDIMPMKIHEDIIIFCKKSATYHPQKEKVNRIVNKRKGVIDKITNTDLKDAIYDNNGENYPTSIVYCKRELNKGRHPTQKPLKLFSYLIRTHSNEGELVLDNCMGSWTTAKACQELGRDFIGVDLEMDYCRIGEQRLQHQPLFTV